MFISSRSVFGRLLCVAMLLAGRCAYAAGMPVPVSNVADGVLTADQVSELARDAPPNTGDNSHVGYFGIGTPPSPQQVAAWSIAVLPDGTGLPPGSGSVAQGSSVFAAQCAQCHGIFGEGVGRYPKLASNDKLTLDQPDRTVGNFWPYSPGLWDYINRAMPFYAPHSLSPDQVYALTAYILNLDNIVPDGFVADAKSLPQVKLVNRRGFILIDPRPDTTDKECMTNCVEPGSVRVEASAERTGLTPRETGPPDTMKVR